MGASPLTRGKPGPLTRGGRGHGRIPAHAGKTLLEVTEKDTIGAHPRSRGENRHRLPRPRVLPGASPLTRGKQRTHQHGTDEGRRIPAHAGKTGSSFVEVRVAWAHPRSRGENPHLVTMDEIWKGASPLTRGKRSVETEVATATGRIPAHAGKTKKRPRLMASKRAHPRSRGENWSRPSWSWSVKGASPLTRGKLYSSNYPELLLGRIPAHAGKTERRGRPESGRPAHPRSRGENSASALAFSRPHGASPLTRGKRGGPARDYRGAGRIPAHAGKTARRGGCVHALRAHPRSRGENPPRGHREGHDRGASPLTRGKRRASTWRSASRGRIPAHAGKTPGTQPSRCRARAHHRSRGENVR